jgi:hypothetical protein
MKSFLLNEFREFRFAGALAVALLLPMGLQAGEAIQFSNTKGHPDPNQKQKLQGEASRAGLKFGAPGPMEGVSPGLYESRRRDPRSERKAQNAQDEKQNWMVLEPGQLDAEDDDKNAFGLKDYELDKSKGKRDYFFAPPEDKGDRTGRPRQQLGRPPGKTRNPSEGGPKDTPRDSDQADKDSNAKGNQSVEKEGRPVGDHVSKALDLKDLLAPGKANSLAPAEDKTDKLWKDILGSGATSDPRAEAPRREDGSVADGFRPAPSGAFRAQSSTPSLGFRNDFSPRPSASSSPGPSGSASTGFTPPAPPLAPHASDPYGGGPSAPPTAGRVPTPDNSYSARPNGLGSGPAGSPYGQQPPPRRSSGSFEIPSRPGYGGR